MRARGGSWCHPGTFVSQHACLARFCCYFPFGNANFAVPYFTTSTEGVFAPNFQWKCIIFACYFWKFKSRSLLLQPTLFLHLIFSGNTLFSPVIFGNSKVVVYHFNRRCFCSNFVLFQPRFVMLLFYSSLRGIFPWTRGQLALTGSGKCTSRCTLQLCMPQLENAVGSTYICTYACVRRRALSVFSQVTGLSHGRKVSPPGYSCPSDVKLPKPCKLNKRVCVKIPWAIGDVLLDFG